MLTLCPKCHLHYDDSSQSPHCDGPGGRDSEGTKPHRQVMTKPVDEHIANTKEAARLRGVRQSRGPAPRPGN